MARGVDGSDSAGSGRVSAQHGGVRGGLPPPRRRLLRARALRRRNARAAQALLVSPLLYLPTLEHYSVVSGRKVRQF